MSHKTTVIHWFDFDSWQQRVYVSDPHGNKTGKEYSYMIGDRKPNYPTPATLKNAKDATAYRNAGTFYIHSLIRYDLS